MPLFCADSLPSISRNPHLRTWLVLLQPYPTIQGTLRIMKKPHSSRHALNEVMTANIVGNQRFATMVYTTTLELPIFSKQNLSLTILSFICKIKEKKTQFPLLKLRFVVILSCDVKLANTQKEHCGGCF